MGQSKYMTDLLFKANMHNAKHVLILMSTAAKLMAFDGVTFENPQLHCSIVGNLQYSTFTRSNIFFAVNKVCQFIYFHLVS